MAKISPEICSYFIIFTNQIDPGAEKMANGLLEKAYGNILAAEKKNVKVIIISPRKQTYAKDK